MYSFRKIGLKQKNGRDSETSGAFAALRIQNEAAVTNKNIRKDYCRADTKKALFFRGLSNDTLSLWLI